MGIRWETFLSLAKTIRMASCCSVILSSMASDDPQRVTQLAFRLWSGSCFSCWALARSLFFFQLQENVAMTCQQTLRTLMTLRSSKDFRTARKCLKEWFLNILSCMVLSKTHSTKAIAPELPCAIYVMHGESYVRIRWPRGPQICGTREINNSLSF